MFSSTSAGLGRPGAASPFPPLPPDATDTCDVSEPFLLWLLWREFSDFASDSISLEISETVSHDPPPFTLRLPRNPRIGNWTKNQATYLTANLTFAYTCESETSCLRNVRKIARFSFLFFSEPNSGVKDCPQHRPITPGHWIAHLFASSSLANRASSSVGISCEGVSRCSQRVSNGGLGSILPVCVTVLRVD